MIAFYLLVAADIVTGTLLAPAEERVQRRDKNKDDHQHTDKEPSPQDHKLDP
jgi:hypothetical protein